MCTLHYSVKKYRTAQLRVLVQARVRLSPFFFRFACLHPSQSRCCQHRVYVCNFAEEMVHACLGKAKRPPIQCKCNAKKDKTENEKRPSEDGNNKERNGQGTAVSSVPIKQLPGFQPCEREIERPGWYGLRQGKVARWRQ